MKIDNTDHSVNFVLPDSLRIEIQWKDDRECSE